MINDNLSKAVGLLTKFSTKWCSWFQFQNQPKSSSNLSILTWIFNGWVSRALCLPCAPRLALLLLCAAAVRKPPASLAPSLSAPVPTELATWLPGDRETKKVIQTMMNKGARLSRAQTVATRTHFVIPAGKMFAHHLIMEIQIQRKPQTRILTRIRMLKHHARLLGTTITTRQLMSKHTIITTLPSHHTHLPSHLPMHQLLSTNCLPRHHTSLLETTIIPIICDTDLILQIHLLMRIRRKSLRQVRNKRNQLRSLTVPAAAPSKASSPPPPPPINLAGCFTRAD